MAEEEVPVVAERVLKILRVFINQLDTYSSGNIGKVSGGRSQTQWSVCVLGPSPQQRSALQAVRSLGGAGGGGGGGFQSWHVTVSRTCP